MIPSFINSILWTFYLVMPSIPYLIKSNKLTKECNQQIQKLYTDEDKTKSHKEIIFIQRLALFLLGLSSIVALLLSFN